MKHISIFILTIALLTGCAGDTSQQVQVTAPVLSDASPKVEGTATSPPCIHINTATLVEIATLPGIGPVLGQLVLDHITANGPFETVEDIQNVPGIGADAVEMIRPYVCVP